MLYSSYQKEFDMKITREELERYFYVEKFHEGHARVQKKQNGVWQFVNRFGELSEEFYDACKYHNGYALVKKEENGKWQFRNMNGELSKEFYAASNYYKDYAIVQKRKNGNYQYRNIYGELSKQAFKDYFTTRVVDPKTLTYAPDVERDFFAVDITDSKNIKNMSDIIKEISIYDLSQKEIYDNLDVIVAQINNDYKRLISCCSTREQMEEISKLFEEETEYVKSMAYEEYELTKHREEFEGKNLF